VMLMFTIISCVLYAYFMAWTTFVLVVECIFGVIGLWFPVVELFFCLSTIIKLKGARPNLA
jgi:hypothetical protein